jgi:hypothetical protein
MLQIWRALAAAAAATGLVWLAAAGAAHAQPVPNPTAGGITFPGSVKVGDSLLTLNGTGVRSVAIITGYAAALYVASRSDNPGTLASMPGAKKLRIHMLLEVPAEEFDKAMNKGIRRNSTPEQQAALAERMAQFGKLINAVGKVKKGDVIDLEHQPGQGMAFSLNGKLQGSRIAGEDFFPAVLRSFVGERPYDPKLKQGLLGKLPA